MTEQNIVREGLADYAHEAWSRWMEYLFSKCTIGADGAIIPSELVTRWQRQMATPYAQLTESEKQSDREEADKMLKVINDETHAPIVQETVCSHASNDHAGNRGYVASGREGVDNLG